MSLEDIVDAVLGIKTTTIVVCPKRPVRIAGSYSSGAYEANDAMGLLTKVAVPKRGVIVSATLFDLDYEGKQIDLEVFNNKITQVASEAAWTLSDEESLFFITELPFVAFDAHTASQTSEITNIGKAYVAPGGFFWVQAVTRGTPTIAAGAEPHFQLQIQSFDPTFKES